MADELNTQPTAAALNEVVDLLSALKSSSLGKLIGRSAAGGCDYDCSCNQSMCGCRGSVKAVFMDTVSFPEFMAMREERLAELKRAMQALEVPKDLR